jgi:hypothetical protein
MTTAMPADGVITIGRGERIVYLTLKYLCEEKPGAIGAVNQPMGYMGESKVAPTVARWDRAHQQYHRIRGDLKVGESCALRCEVEPTNVVLYPVLSPDVKVTVG